VAISLVVDMPLMQILRQTDVEVHTGHGPYAGTGQAQRFHGELHAIWRGPPNGESEQSPISTLQAPPFRYSQLLPRRTRIQEIRSIV
jgi:hypothetical protein